MTACWLSSPQLMGVVQMRLAALRKAADGTPEHRLLDPVLRWLRSKPVLGCVS